MAVVRATGVSKRYGARTVLHGVDLAVEAGRVLLLQGRSGSGKSTLLHILAGIEAPSSGVVELAGQDLAGLDGRARARLRITTVGLVFQHFNLIPDLTAEENVRLPIQLAKQSRARPGRPRELLEQVGMGGHARSFPGSLSGGEMQRVAIARALANDPPLILADEPTANLDEANAEAVFRLLSDLGTQGKAVVVASHDSLALEHFDHPRELRDGALVGP